MQRILQIQLYNAEVADALAGAVKRIPGVINVLRFRKPQFLSLFVTLWDGTDIEQIEAEVKTRDERAWIIGGEED